MAIANIPREKGPYDPYLADGVTFADLPFNVVSNATELINTIAAFNALGLSGTIYCAPGTYTLPAGAGPIVQTDGVNIIGPGERVGMIVFSPTAHDQAPIKFQKAGTSINQCSISGFSFSSADTTFRKRMIDVVDARQFEASHIGSTDTTWSDASFLSEGIRFAGREALHLHDSTIYADIPVHFTANPVFPGLEADHTHLGPALILGSRVGNPTIKVDAAVVFSNVGFDGIAFVRGGFQWAGTSATASYDITFRNIRMEQEATGTWIIDISGTTVVQELVIESVRGGAGIASARDGKGIRLRNCYIPTLIDYRYLGITTTLDIDATVYNFTGINCAWGASSDGVTASITGQTLLRAQGSGNVTSPIPSPNVWYQSTNVTFLEVQEFGTHKLFFKGQLANGGQLNLAAAGFTGTGSESVIAIRVDAVRVDNGNPVGGSVTVSMTGTHGVSHGLDAANPFIYGNTAGQLSILWQSNSNITLLNQVGAAVNYMVEMRWY